MLRLDSRYFTEDMIKELVSACYGSPLDVCHEPLESILQIIDGALYLGMNAVSLLCEAALATKIDATNLPDFVAFASENGRQLLLLECHKFLCRNLEAVEQAGGLAQVEYDQMKEMLQSNFVESSEDDILAAVLKWSEATSASFDSTKELVDLVRLSFVPVDSAVMTKAVKKNFVNENMLRSCRLFQTNGDYRARMINSEPQYRPRQGESTKANFAGHLEDLREIERHREILRRRERERFMDDDFVVMRMLGTVNGRNNFDKIRSVQKSQDGDDRLVCTFNESDVNAKYSEHESGYFSIPFKFEGLQTDHMPPPQNKKLKRIDRASLGNYSLEDVEQRLAAILQRENALRLHPRVQAAYGAIGENEEEMSTFTTALQAHVATEFNVDAAVGVELIRSASTLFPETAKLVHYVRYNRCSKGSLSVGDVSPDVKLSTLAGSKTTLWTEVDARSRSLPTSNSSGNEDKPVVILGASYT